MPGNKYGEKYFDLIIAEQCDKNISEMISNRVT
jgi:hypothetical protein